MKKVLVVALSALLILALFIPAMAEDGPKFTTTVSATKVKRGEEITVTVVMDKALKTQGIGFNYDTTYSHFEYVKGTWCDDIRNNEYTAMQKANALGQAVFAAEEAIDIPAGVVFTLKLKAKEDAAFESVNLEVTLSATTAPEGSSTVPATVEIYHDCVPATEYTTDANDHWKACTVVGCSVAPAKEAHKYDNACDTTCNICNHPRTITHDFSVANKDADYHWNECSVCHVVDETSKAAHTPKADDVLVTPADCANPAVYKKECSVCNTQIGATFTVGTPNASLHSGGTATCTAKAICQHCSQAYGEVDPAKHTGATKIEKSADEHWEVCQACLNEVADTRTAHTGGTATCVDKKVCTVCSTAYGEVDATKHTGTTKIEKNATEHWTVCNSCSAEIADSRTAHTGGTATCKDKAVCTVCSTAYGEVDPTKHTGNVEAILAVPSTCTVLGTTAGEKCADCGEVTLAPETLTELAPHSVTTWTEVKPATEAEKGEKKGKCDVCETEFTVETDKLAATVKEENVIAPEGSKVELGETKLPENTVVAIVPIEDSLLKDVAEESKTELDKIPEAAGKDVLAATSVAIVPPTTYVDPTTGETVIDDGLSDKLPGKVKVTAPISADLTNYEGIVVLVVDADGKMTKVDATVENGFVVFETDSVAGGVIVLGAEKQAPAPSAPGAQTGDASQVALFISLAIVSLLSLGYVSKKAKASK